jgi:hypothetical protein
MKIYFVPTPKYPFGRVPKLSSERCEPLLFIQRTHGHLNFFEKFFELLNRSTSITKSPRALRVPAKTNSSTKTLDLETRNVIDKFAAYVAKNGPGFEEISRQKNADNPKFGFLFGGEHHQYYQFRLMWEIQQCKHISYDGLKTNRIF